MRTNHYYFRTSAAIAAAVASSLLLLLLGPALPVQAQSQLAGTTITVNTTEDELNTDGDCSLREAVQAANTSARVDRCRAGSASGEDLIVFELGKNATITLDSEVGQLIVTDAAGLRINGGMNKSVSVSGGDQTRVFLVNGGAELAIRNLRVANGSANFGGPGGGIINEGMLTVSNSTFSQNSAQAGGGIFNQQGTTATLRNTIVAYSPRGGNCSGPITDGRYNSSSDDTCAFTDPTSKNSTDPLLDPNGLQNNGGPTQTIALLKGSPAIDAIPKGTNGCGTEIRTDQRGVKRPQGNRCDIGAFERKKR